MGLHSVKLSHQNIANFFSEQTKNIETTQKTKTTKIPASPLLARQISTTNTNEYPSQIFNRDGYSFALVGNDALLKAHELFDELGWSAAHQSATIAFKMAAPLALSNLHPDSIAPVRSQ